jgi:1-deoxy-D-xylulose-5-phosphate synthase
MTNILDQVSVPEDLRSLSLEQLDLLAAEVRHRIIETVSRTGGHLASSLGAVELTIALHYVYNTPHDRIVWDVGHQSYAHKILTGRAPAFETLRQQGGLSGFPKRDESPYDAFNVGHSSTSISAALGMAQASCLSGQPRKVIAVIGDGSLMAGMALEGLNYAGHIQKDLLVILNDNEMSISPNVGALSSALSRIISGQAYNKFRDRVHLLLKKIPGIGKSMSRIARHGEDFMKGLFVPGLIFDEFGFNYIGPVLGHRIDVLIENLSNIKNLNGPVLLHVITKKGKGYEPAENDPTYFHGVGPFDRDSGKPRSGKAPVSYTAMFSRTLVRAAESDARVVAITAGMTTGTGLEEFEKKYPERFFDVGIAEQHAVTFAAGLAVEGFKPVVAIYSTFLQRSYDQVLHDVCVQNLPVIFMLDRAGLVGEDGPTHHGLFDVSYLRPMPNMTFMAPRDENELQHMFYTALQLNAPVAIRYPRGSGYGVELDQNFRVLPLGKAEELRQGSDVALFAIGATVYPALEAADRLKAAGIGCAVINSRFIKPLDEEMLRTYASGGRMLVSVEESMLQGGFGSAMLEHLQAAGCTTPLLRLGIPDTFVAQATQKQQRALCGIDADGIYAAVRTAFEKQPKP